MRSKFFQRLIRLAGLHGLHQFHFLELVLPDHALGIATGRAGFRAEARRERGVAEGELFERGDLLANEVGQRDFGCGDEPVARDQILIFLPKLFKFLSSLNIINTSIFNYFILSVKNICIWINLFGEIHNANLSSKQRSLFGT